MSEKISSFQSVYGIEAEHLPRGIWVALEGTDAVGKTYQLQQLTEAVRTVIPCTSIQEFSNSPLGHTITDILHRQRFFSLDPDRRTPLADTLALMADQMFCIERDIRPMVARKGIVFSDRGPASLIAYQAQRLHLWSPDQFPLLDDAVDYVVQLLAKNPIKPDKTVLLTINDEERQRRISHRGEKKLNSEELTFLHRADKLMERAARLTSAEVMIIDAVGSPKSVTQKILSTICT